LKVSANGISARRQREASFVLAAFLLSGVSALIYEVIWTRALSLVLGNTTYAISTMLATFMAGLAIGAYLCGRYCDRNSNLMFAFGICEMGIGISGLLCLPIIYSLPLVYIKIYNTFHMYPAAFFFFQVLLCVIVMLPPTLLMGATFPLVSKKVTRSMNELGSKVSKAYSMNTLGAVAGSLVAGFFLIPAIGLKGATTVAASLNLIVGFTLVLMSGRRVPVLVSSSIVIALLSCSVNYSAEHSDPLINFHTATRETDAMKQENDAKYGFSQVFYEESIEGPVRAYKKDGMLYLQVSGKLEGTGHGDMPCTKLLAYLPLASHPSPGNFLTIGLGAGVTVSAAKSVLWDVDVVEINPSVIKAVGLHGIEGVLDGVNMIKNDARNYLLRTNNRYDIISSQPSYPTESTVANLYTKEFYELAARRLNKQGVFAQWLPNDVLRYTEIMMMVKTFGSIFAYVNVWKIYDGDIIMVGSMEPFKYDPNKTSMIVSMLDKNKSPLNFGLVMRPQDVAVLKYDSDITINTDNHPVLEFKIVNNMLTACSRCDEDH
jgi:spermidine synthase